MNFALSDLVGKQFSPRIRELGGIALLPHRYQGHDGGSLSQQGLCLTAVTNAIVAWTTEDLALAVAERRAGDNQVDDEVLAHVSPAHNENVDFYGTFSFEVERELAQLIAGYRPLRLVK